MTWASLRGQSVLVVICLAAFTLVAVNGASGQDVVPYRSGQNVAPAFEGWEENPDGTFNMVFGYFNRNYEEILDIPIGPSNMIEPGPPDQGQPTHFFPRRGWFVFRIKVPKDFGNRELVWTLARGRTEKAYATLKPDYVFDKTTMMANNDGAASMRGNEGENEWPTIRVEGDTRRTVKVGQPLTLTAIASDDGRPVPGPQRSRSGSEGGRFRAGWYVYRGAGKVIFDPEEVRPNPVSWAPRDGQARTAETANATALAGTQSRREAQTPATIDVFAKVTAIPVVDRKVPVTVTFISPGTYVLRALAHDGGLDATQEVTVTVLPQ